MGWDYGGERAEQAFDVAAAAIFAAAAAFAARTLAGGGEPLAAAVAAAAFLIAYAGLRHLPVDEPTHALPAFPLTAIEFAPGTEELLLDDRLTTVDPGARIVQLFGPREAKEPSGRHRSSGSNAAPPDASQALSAALAELRRSLH